MTQDPVRAIHEAMMTKSERRKLRQSESTARTMARLAAGDTRNARERHSDALVTAAKAKRRKPRRKATRTPVHGSAEWAETRGDDIPSLDQPGDDFDTEDR